MHIPGSKYKYPWRPGNRFELLVDGAVYFPRMLEAIARARHQVWLEIYLFESGVIATRFISALVEAAQRGVIVLLLADAYGATALSEADRHRLLEAGVKLHFYNPLRWRQWFGNLFRDHRKLLIVDGEEAFVSGTGITDEFDDPDNPRNSWRETTICACGPVLEDWQALFLQVWQEHASSDRPGTQSVSEPLAEGVPGRVAVSAGLREQDIRRSLYNRVRVAQARVWMATAYFVPSRRLLRALRRAAERGVDVRLLLPGPITDHPAVRHAGRRFYGGLLRAGVRLFEYQPRFLHAKGMLCDDWVTIGSSNFDRWNLRWNLEANQEVEDARFAREVATMFERDFRDCLEIRHEDWRRRGWQTRMREQLWGRVDMLLDSLGRIRGVRMNKAPARPPNSTRSDRKV